MITLHSGFISGQAETDVFPSQDGVPKALPKPEAILVNAPRHQIAVVVDFHFEYDQFLYCVQMMSEIKYGEAYQRVLGVI